MSRFSPEEPSSVEERRIQIVGRCQNRRRLGTILQVQITSKVLVAVC